MGILVGSLLGTAQRLHSSIHFGYVEEKGKTVATSEAEKEYGRKTSWVIIRRPYTHLEPAIRTMFQEAEDVRIILDRRWHERRQTTMQPALERRKATNDRRRSVPMVEIVVNVGI